MKFDYCDSLVIDDDEIFEKIRDNYYPEDVFSPKQLNEWALSNNFIEEE